ncbi:MAG: hypothetical protein HDR49_05285 [Bacteroides sp.]|nr:hypothetical protein [Bacteroides sp.]MBD5422425.1 hypothetical protein [Bacteroides sp.]
MKRPNILPLLSTPQKIFYCSVPLIGLFMLCNNPNHPNWINWTGAVLSLSGLLLQTWVYHKIDNTKWMRRSLYTAIIGFVLIALLLTIGVKYYNEYVLSSGVS